MVPLGPPLQLASSEILLGASLRILCSRANISRRHSLDRPHKCNRDKLSRKITQNESASSTLIRNDHEMAQALLMILTYDGTHSYPVDGANR